MPELDAAPRPPQPAPARRARHAVLLITLGLASAPAVAGPDAWERLRRAEPAALLSEPLPADATPELRLAHATAELQHPARSSANVRRALGLLAPLLAVDPASHSAAAAAAFLAARIAHLHAPDGSPAAGAAAYVRLFRAAPASPWGEQAAIHFGILRLADPSVPLSELPGRIAETAALASSLPSPSGRATLHWLATQTALRSDQPPGFTLGLAEATLADGLADTRLAADARFLAAWLHDTLQQAAQARAHYEAFLAAHPADNRRRLAQDRLSALGR